MNKASFNSIWVSFFFSYTLRYVIIFWSNWNNQLLAEQASPALRKDSSRHLNPRRAPNQSLSQLSVWIASADLRGPCQSRLCFFFFCFCCSPCRSPPCCFLCIPSEPSSEPQVLFIYGGPEGWYWFSVCWLQADKKWWSQVGVKTKPNPRKLRLCPPSIKCSLWI